MARMKHYYFDSSRKEKHKKGVNGKVKKNEGPDAVALESWGVQDSGCKSRTGLADEGLRCPTKKEVEIEI